MDNTWFLTHPFAAASTYTLLWTHGVN